MNKTMAGLVFGMTLTLSLPAGAHTDEYFESVEAPHGGQLRMTGPFHMELVAKEGDLTVYVTDHADNPISVDGGLAKATVETGSNRTQVHLHPVGTNMLKGSGTFSLDHEYRRHRLHEAAESGRLCRPLHAAQAQTGSKPKTPGRKVNNRGWRTPPPSPPAEALSAWVNRPSQSGRRWLSGRTDHETSAGKHRFVHHAARGSAGRSPLGETVRSRESSSTADNRLPRGPIIWSWSRRTEN